MTDAAMSLDGKRVQLIGGASGIGFAVADDAAYAHANALMKSMKARSGVGTRRRPG
jgi:NAD(P)-dependent dehydrogenase (short-subunit alcohol dehydrogenase family)